MTQMHPPQTLWALLLFYKGVQVHAWAPYFFFLFFVISFCSFFLPFMLLLTFMLLPPFGLLLFAIVLFRYLFLHTIVMFPFMLLFLVFTLLLCPCFVLLELVLLSSFSHFARFELFLVTIDNIFLQGKFVSFIFLCFFFSRLCFCFF